LKIKKEIPFMRTNKNYWLAASGTVAVAGAIMLFSAHRIEAQYSSPVKVLNASSAPVLNSRIDEPGRIPYRVLLDSVCAGNQCQFFNSPVLPGHRVVIQHLSAVLVFTGQPAAVFATLGTSIGSPPISFNVPPPVGLNTTVFDQPVLHYLDAGEGPVTQFVTVAPGTFSAGATQQLTLVGYELDCNAAPCAAIANR
jgi:hypothetical protein